MLPLAVATSSRTQSLHARLLGCGGLTYITLTKVDTFGTDSKSNVHAVIDYERDSMFLGHFVEFRCSFYELCGVAGLVTVLDDSDT